jgi:hypothetical protein
MLHGVGDFMRGDCHGGDGAPSMVLRQQPDSARLRIIVIAFVGFLDRHSLQPRLVEQMARKLSAGAGKIRPLAAMLRQHTADPELRTEDDRKDQKSAGDEKDRHAVSPRSSCFDHRAAHAQFSIRILACCTILPNFAASDTTKAL